METTASNTGPLGQPRGIGFAIIIFIITFGIYSLYWVFKTQEEVKNHSDQGVGGVLGLVIYIVVGIVTRLETGDEVEVLSGLSPGERVVVDAPPQLKDGDRVKVR